MSVAFVLMIYGPSTPPHALNSQQSKVQVEPKVKTYGFVHLETTGITSYVIINGKEMPIQFRADSDPLAMKSLYALNSRILLPNTDGKKLFLIGQYFAEPKHTRSCRQCATVEEYREFKLVDWYIITPFKVVREDCGPCPYLREENLRKKSGLDLKDFQDFAGRDNMDVRRFQREKRIASRHRI
jgi:hypothetical protein